MQRGGNGRSVAGDAPGTYAAGLSEADIRAAGEGCRVVKLNSNENALGLGAAALAAARDALADAHRYPPGQDEALREAIAAHHGAQASQVVVGPGSVALVERVIQALCLPGPQGPGGGALAFEPCFAGFVARARSMGAVLRRVPLAADFSMPLEALAHAVEDDTVLVYMANPDNPSGRTVGAEDLAALGRALPPGALLLVDEAYADFADDPDSLSLLPLLGALPNCAVLRTFSKAHGLAGLRVGYAVLPRQIAARVRTLLPPFGVTASASAAAYAALADTAHHAASVTLARQGRRFLFAELGRLGCEPVPGQGPFVMFHPPHPAGEVFQALLVRGVAVRPLGYVGLEGWLRVSCGTMEDNRLFVQALAAVLGAQE